MLAKVVQECDGATHVKDYSASTGFHVGTWLAVTVFGVLISMSLFFVLDRLFNVPKVEMLRPFGKVTNVPSIDVPALAHANHEELNVPKAVAKPKVGNLALSIKPWANVYIMGEFVGATPLGPLDLPEGEYIVQLVNPELSQSALRMVRIKSGKKTKLEHVFR